MVVARDTNRLAGKYGSLIPGVNLVGNTPGLLSHGGEQLALLDAAGVLVHEVTYGDGGRWGQWADGGGSSLELIDPRSDNRLAANWADSDETAKATNWVLISRTNYMDYGAVKYVTNVVKATAVEISLAGTGECLVDDVQVSRTNVTYVTNSAFSLGTNGWLLQGNHRRSSVVTNGGFGGGAALCVRASGRGDTKANRIGGFLDPTNLTAGNIVGLSARARWLRGSSNLVLRLHGNWLEAEGSLPVPANLGTPGAVNSRYRTNAGPAIDDVRHWPVLPASGQSVLVTARVHDPDGVANVVLRYRTDPSSAALTNVMNDAGTVGDATAGDALYSGVIPGQPGGTLVAFYLQALDSTAAHATNTFPSDAPARECLVRWGETNAPGGFGNYRIWYAQATSNVLANWQRTSNEPLEAAFVYGDLRVVYNVGLSYSGGPYTVGLYDDPPSTYMSAYSVAFPSDDRLLGSSGAVLDWPIRDPTAQREQVANWIAGEMGLYNNYRRFVHLFVNGKPMSDRLTFPNAWTTGGAKVYEDTQQPNGEVLEQWFPGHDEGPLYKFDAWYECHVSAGMPEPTFMHANPKVTNYVTTNYLTGQAEKKLCAYRVFFGERAGTSPAEITNLWALIDALNTTNTGAAYTTQLSTHIAVDQWMRVFAFQDAVANFDSLGNDTSKNVSLYKPPADGLWWVLSSDLDVGLGETFTCTDFTKKLFSTEDATMARLIAHPPFQRAYWRGIEDALDGPLAAANLDPVLYGNYTALSANGVVLSNNVPVLSPDQTPVLGCTNALRTWVAARRAFLTNELAKVAAPFEISNNNGNSFEVTNQSSLTLFGKAPVEVASMQAKRINGTNSLIVQMGLANWTSVTNWSMPMALPNGTNTFEVTGFNRLGFSNAFDSITVRSW